MYLGGLGSKCGLSRTSENEDGRTTTDLITDADLAGLIYLDAVEISAVGTAQVSTDIANHTSSKMIRQQVYINAASNTRFPQIEITG